MTDSGAPEQRYRQLLAWYPRCFRREHEEEILSILMAGAQDGQQRPRLGESADLITHAIWMRAGSRVPRSQPAVRRAVRLMYLCAVLRLLGLPILPASNSHTAHPLDIGISWGVFAALAWANSRAHNWARLLFIVWFAVHSVALGYDLAHLSAATPALAAITSVVLWTIELCAVVLIMRGHSRAYYRRAPA